uniref:Reverse transcriptase domain-containing protein n=1 Tax=Caenorhabditis tropicalis TaxID=1561998 RepID=A0A1I7UUP9_9PELO
MADRQSSSQNMNSRYADKQGQYNQNHHNYQSSSNNQCQQFQNGRGAQRFEVTNSFKKDDRRQPEEVFFCKYNPLHVVSVELQKLHEEKECPDRKWNPGDKITKYHDIKV